MKIAILGSRGIPAAYGGFETYAEYLSVGMVSDGCDVRVYCPNYQAYKGNMYKGVFLVKIFCPDNLFSNRILRAISNLIYDIISIVHVSLSDVDIVYMLGYASGPFLSLPKFFGKKVIVNPDGLEWKSTRWGFFARKWLFFCEYFSAKFSDGIIADAPPIKDRFVDKYNANATCIEYGADEEPYVERKIEHEDFSYYLAVARIVPETSINTIIDGYKKSGTKKRLIIVGPIADQRFYKEEIAPRVGGDVIYLGSIYDRALLQNYRAKAAALLHGHASDGTNPSLLESMACGSPVLAISTVSNKAVLGDVGFYFSDVSSLSEKIKYFECISMEDRMSLVREGKEIIAKKYSWSAVVCKHVDYFSNFLGK